VHKFSISNLFNILKFSQDSSAYHTRGHRFKLNVTRCFKNVFKHYFISRVVNVWNKLPDSCCNSNTIFCFKSKLYEIDFNEFLCSRQ
jgi:hypothetical protein